MVGWSVWGLGDTQLAVADSVQTMLAAGVAGRSGGGDGAEQPVLVALGRAILAMQRDQWPAYTTLLGPELSAEDAVAACNVESQEP